MSEPLGSTLADFLPLRQPEQHLVDACRAGEVAALGRSRPRHAADDNTIRASLIRFLALGGDSATPVHAEGVRIHGAWIEGNIAFRNLELRSPLSIWNSTIDGAVILFDAQIRHLSLDGSQIRALFGDRLRCSGGIFLREGFESLSVIRLCGAQIGGDADLSAGAFWEEDGISVTFEGANIGGSIYFTKKSIFAGAISLATAIVRGRIELGGATMLPCGRISILADGIEAIGGLSINSGFSSFGELRFFGAKIGQSLDLSEGTYRAVNSPAMSFDRASINGSIFLRDGFSAQGEVRFSGARIAGDFDAVGGKFENKGDIAVNLERASVDGAVFLFRGCKIIGGMNFENATFGVLCHDRASWPEAGNIYLDGARFGIYTGGSRINANEAINWLNLQEDRHLNADFRPQPWEHLANALVAVGHESDARVIRIEKRRKMRWLDYRSARNGYTQFKSALGAIGDAGLDLFIGYGFRPWRAVLSLGVLWFLGAIFFSFAEYRGIMAPTDSKVYLDSSIPAECREHWTNFSIRLNRKNNELAELELAQARGAAGISPGVGTWQEVCPRLLPAEYSTFQPLAYSLDIVLPLVDLRQERDWAPRVSDGNGNTLVLGHVVRLWEWFQILAGWGFSLLLVAAISGVVRRN